MRDNSKKAEQQCAIRNVSGMLPDEVSNLFVTLAQQIHYESVINGLDMRGITECFNELQEAYKKERSNQQREPLLAYHRYLTEELSLDLHELWVDEHLKANNCG
jgi:hypothetical protein